MRELTTKEKMSLVKSYAASLGLKSSFSKKGELIVKEDFYANTFRYHDCYDIYERENDRIYEDEIQIILRRNFG